ncbi:MAG TPA: hypothetical protein VN688_15380 [Gemmataceae bacterium]|nr:hypothetical protein [Gemmataceae bacterium]
MTVSPSRPRSRRWIWFFLVLGVLTAAGIIIPIVYNLGIQLRPEQLADARRRWQENNPANYDLKYLVKTTYADQQEEDQYLLKVRGGRTVFIACNDEVRWVDPSLAIVAGPGVLALSSEDTARYGIVALFNEIEAALRRDATAERRNLVKASFDPNDGHPSHYIHRVRGTKNQVEWFVKFTHIK